MLFSVLLLAGCDGKKMSQMEDGSVGRVVGKADKQKLEKKLKEFNPEIIIKGVKPLAVVDVAKLKNELAAKTGKISMLAGGGDGYSCNFSGHSLAAFLAEYSRLTGKTVIQEAKEPEEGITFKLEEALPVAEATRAMEVFLGEKLNIVIMTDIAGDLKAVKRMPVGK